MTLSSYRIRAPGALYVICSTLLVVGDSGRTRICLRLYTVACLNRCQIVTNRVLVAYNTRTFNFAFRSSESLALGRFTIGLAVVCKIEQNGARRLVELVIPCPVENVVHNTLVMRWMIVFWDI